VLARPGLFEVDSPKHVSAVGYLFRRNLRQARGPERKWCTGGECEEPLGRCDTEAPEPVGLNDDGQRRTVLRRVRAGQQQAILRVMANAQDEVKAFIRRECRLLARPAPWLEAELRIRIGRSGRQPDQIGEELGPPEQGDFIAAAVRVLEDFATPSDGPSRPANAQLLVGLRAQPHRRGNRDCGAGTPMPSRSDRVPSDTDRRPEAALYRASSFDRGRARACTSVQKPEFIFPTVRQN
jgi:hypothetical protein